MKSKSLGCLTTLGLVAMAIAVFAVGTSYAFNRSKMFSPGELSQQFGGEMIGGINSHAELDENCAACHPAPWDLRGMTNLCLDCHAEIVQEMTGSDTLHGAVKIAFGGSACQDCHTEHRGSDANITDFLASDFPHELVGFSLRSHENIESNEIVCQNCHLEGFAVFAESVCEGCHTDYDRVYMSDHTILFGTDCRACHDGVETYGGRFDHNNYYLLVGKHETTECINCHEGATTLAMLEKTPQDCFSCHSVDDHHDGGLGQDCQNCHSPQGWLPADFDHAITGFPLIGGHEDVICSDCHVEKDFQAADPACASCHLGDDPHGGVLGQACESCHSVSSWSDINFNHTGPFSGECLACHSSDAPNGHYPGQCSACHSTNAWKPASFNHSAAGATDCVSCHSKDEPNNHFSGQCSACHSTSAWKPASFNHSAAGATNCTSCHSNDKPNNHFSGQCSTCHSTNAWKPASFKHTFPLNHGGANQRCELCHSNQNYSAYTCYGCHEHNKTEIQKEHDDVSNISNCIRCHPDGREHDD
jgi:hypothetical protein